MMPRLRLVVCALLLAGLCAATPAAAGDECGVLWHQLDAALEDLDSQLDANDALAAVVGAPGFDPAGVDGWMVDALANGTAEVAGLRDYVGAVAAQIKSAQCY